jgi:lysophospholipid acyltransferase (LPLAT)-like uncharacterized protein
LGELIKRKWREIRPELISGILYAILRLVGMTLRMKVEGFPDDDTKCIFCGWHGRSFMFGNFFRRRNYYVIISQSRDGDMQNHIFQKLGYRTIRGSTARNGAQAAIESIRALKSNGTMALTPDGPRGPSHVVQGGVMLIARKSGGLLIPVGIAAKPRFHIRSWDRYMVPLPFARGLMIFGDPISLPRDADEETVEARRLELENEINRLEVEAERRV